MLQFFPNKILYLFFIVVFFLYFSIESQNLFVFYTYSSSNSGSSAEASRIEPFRTPAHLPRLPSAS